MLIVVLLNKVVKGSQFEIQELLECLKNKIKMLIKVKLVLKVKELHKDQGHIIMIKNNNKKNLLLINLKLINQKLKLMKKITKMVNKKVVLSRKRKLLIKFNLKITKPKKSNQISLQNQKLNKKILILNHKTPHNIKTKLQSHPLNLKQNQKQKNKTHYSPTSKAK